jgi:hypothetical protein
MIRSWLGRKWNQYRRLWTLSAAVATIGVVMGAAFAAGGRDRSVVRVEEDWMFILGEPNSRIASPQISSQMAQSADAALFCNVHLNARDIPRYGEGGLQLQVWRGGDNVGNKTSDSLAVLDTPNEVVTWTQFLSTNGEKMQFGVSAASSQTWGDFSGQSVVVPTDSLSLDNYSVDYSVQNSGVTFGANRVSYLAITEVRIYYSDGTMVTDSTERIVYPSADGSE